MDKMVIMYDVFYLTQFCAKNTWKEEKKKGWFGISEALRYAVYQAMGSIRIWPLLGSDN